MSNPEAIIFHCSDVDQGNAAIIDRYHKNYNGWSRIGYNAVILNGKENNKPYNPARDGIMENGRGIDISAAIEPDERGAHALGYNKNSFGICLIGEASFTLKQFETAILWCRSLRKVFPNIEILGHCETPRTSKTCPNFGMDEFRAAVMDKNKSILDAIKVYLKPWLKAGYTEGPHAVP